MINNAQLSTFTIFLFSFFLFQCNSNSKQENEIEKKVRYIKSFAKLYGYVRFFHPSDEASKIDWGKFAIHGVDKMLQLSSEKELTNSLNKLYSPIAPTLQLVDANSNFTYDTSQLVPPNKENYTSIFWQHRGVNLQNDPHSTYKSIRLNRIVQNSNNYGMVGKYINIEKLKHKNFKLVAKAKQLENKSDAFLWLKTSKGQSRKSLFYKEEPITSPTWKTYEIICKPTEDAKSLLYGGYLNGLGRTSFDDLELFTEKNGTWEKLESENFEMVMPDSLPPMWLKFERRGFEAVISKEKKNNILTIQSINDPSKIFESEHQVGDVFASKISSSIRCFVPMCLYGDEKATFPQADKKRFQDLIQSLEKINAEPYSLSANFADLIVTWNNFQHFYPYFEEVNVDWEKCFDEALKECFTVKTSDEFLNLLKKFTANLKDGHLVIIPLINESNFLPEIQWEWIEEKLMITNAFNSSNDLKTGDIVLKINNQDPEDYFQGFEPYVSAATEVRKKRDLAQITLQGNVNQPIFLKINRGGNTFDLEIRRNISLGEYYQIINSKPKYELFENDIHYLNLAKINKSAIDSLLPSLVKSKGVIFDLRHRPTGDAFFFLSHLMTKPDTTFWMKVPQLISPNYTNVTYKSSNWNIAPTAPNLNPNKVIFITNSNAISYPESILGYVKHYKLGKMLGEGSAGTNGNINVIELPSRTKVVWTGMKVIHHDGSPFHGVGIVPDVFVKKTITGVKDGRDEYLEKAISILSEK